MPFVPIVELLPYFFFWVAMKGARGDRPYRNPRAAPVRRENLLPVHRERPLQYRQNGPRSSNLLQRRHRRAGPSHPARPCLPRIGGTCPAVDREILERHTSRCGARSPAGCRRSRRTWNMQYATGPVFARKCGQHSVAIPGEVARTASSRGSGGSRRRSAGEKTEQAFQRFFKEPAMGLEGGRQPDRGEARREEQDLCSLQGASCTGSPGGILRQLRRLPFHPCGESGDLAAAGRWMDAEIRGQVRRVTQPHRRERIVPFPQQAGKPELGSARETPDAAGVLGHAHSPPRKGPRRHSPSAASC